MRRRESGFITVYLALAMGVLLSLLLTVLEAARQDVIRMQLECAADMALDSALAQYHRETLSQYGLFFIDTAYGTGDPSFHRTEEQIRSYMVKNCRPFEAFGIREAKDITGLSVEDVSLLAAGVATDQNCDVLKYHVVQYMKDMSGLTLGEKLLEIGDELAHTDVSGGIEEDWDNAERRLKEEIAQKKRLRDEEWDGTLPENPSDVVRAARSEGILGLVTRGDRLSAAHITLAALPSGRKCNRGTGLGGTKEAPDGLLEKGLLSAYILEKCGFYGKEKENSALAYEVEYILQRKESDVENLKAMAIELLLIREAINATFLFGSSMQQPARETAVFITGLLGVPELSELMTDVLLFAWAYVESVKDIRILLAGGKVAAVKSESSWNTPFSQLLTYRGHLDSWKDCEDGLSYRDYLGALLLVHGERRAITGLADMMECDIRKTAGNEGFRVDGLIDGMTAEISTVSSYGGAYSITRKYEYE